MTKQIDTLIADIYDCLCNPSKYKVTQEAVTAFGNELARRIGDRLLPRDDTFRLRPSNVGTTCDRKLWYMANRPELGESLNGKTRLKFLYGDVIEALIIFLSRVSGHTVTDEQKPINVSGITGSIDAKIDGCLVDVKSTSTRGMDKFVSGLNPENDDFGYLPQLHTYSTGGDSVGGSFLAVGKETGQLVLDTHVFTGQDISIEIERKQDVIRSERIPDRGFSDTPDGESGNRKLGTVCSYCSFRKHCWPSIRTFAYSGGYRDLTVVVKHPKNKHGPIREIK